MDNKLFEAALTYADRGYPVFPCAPNAKRPLTANGLNDATTDAERIEAWWTAHPGANVAIATAGLLVVDLDGSDNPWLANEPDKLHDLTCASIALTPRGGKHYVFKQPAGAALRNTASKLAPKVDTRADGGYILAAPSVVECKAYKWVSEGLDETAPERLPEPPAWLLAMLNAPAGKAERANVAGSTNAIVDGQRNSTLTSLGGAMRHKGMSQAAIAAALHAENVDRCKPPLDSKEVETIIGSVAKYAPRPNALAAVEGRDGAHTAYQPVLTSLADVQPEQVQWLWPGRIALGKLTLIAGDPGLGKSFLSLDLASRVSLGSPWPDNRDSVAPCGGVVLLNAEDALGDTVRPRLDAMAAEVRRIIALEAIQGENRMPVNLQRDLPAVELAIERIDDCRLVIIDPVSAYLGKVDSHNNADIRAMLHPLSELADRHKVAVVAVTHLNKGQGSALYRATGSLAFVAAARAAWLVAKDPDAPRRRLFLPVKNNLAGDTLGMAYQIGDGVVQWEPEPVTIDPDRLLAPAEPGRDDSNDAAEWLRQELANGPVDSADLHERARENGISRNRLFKAKDLLGVQANKTGFDGRWQWTMPDEESPSVLPKKPVLFVTLGNDSACPAWEDCPQPPPTCPA